MSYLHPEWDTEPACKPLSDKYLKTIKVKGVYMTSFEQRLEDIIRDSIEYGKNPDSMHLLTSRFVKGKVDEIMTLINLEVVKLFKDKEEK